MLTNKILNFGAQKVPMEIIKLLKIFIVSNLKIFINLSHITPTIEHYIAIKTRRLSSLTFTRNEIYN